MPLTLPTAHNKSNFLKEPFLPPLSPTNNDTQKIAADIAGVEAAEVSVEFVGMVRRTFRCSKSRRTDHVVKFTTCRDVPLWPELPANHITPEGHSRPPCRPQPTTSRRSPPTLAGVEGSRQSCRHGRRCLQCTEGGVRAAAGKGNVRHCGISLHGCLLCSHPISCIGTRPLVDSVQIAQGWSLGSSEAGT